MNKYKKLLIDLDPNTLLQLYEQYKTNLRNNVKKHKLLFAEHPYPEENFTEARAAIRMFFMNDGFNVDECDFGQCVYYNNDIKQISNQSVSGFYLITK